MTLKADIVRDICSRLSQKMVIYALQLRNYEKEETHILFHEFWLSVYKFIIERFYFEQMKKFVKIRKRQREVQEYATQILTKLKLQRVLDEWKFSKHNRIMFQQRVQNINEILR